MIKPSARYIFNSRFFSDARRQAEDVVYDPARLKTLVEEARRKAESRKNGPIGEVWGGLMTCFRMLAAYARGDYRHLPVKTLIAVAGAVIYFMMPIDVIPDFILGFGLADDAALIAWTVKSIKSDIDRFAAWEKTKPMSVSGVSGDSAGTPGA